MKKKGRAMRGPKCTATTRGVRWDLSGCPIVLGGPRGELYIVRLDCKLPGEGLGSHHERKNLPLYCCRDCCNRHIEPQRLGSRFPWNGCFRKYAFVAIA